MRLASPRSRPAPRLSSVMKKEDIEGVFAVCYTGNAERQSRLMRELGRVGFDDVNVIWSFPSPYREFILRRMPHELCLDQKPGYWGCTIAHYCAVKTAYHLGMGHALIVEDDCRFLKDVDTIWNNLLEVPGNANIVLLDHLIEVNARTLHETNKFYMCDKSYSTGCYIVDRKGMERYIAMYESPVSGKYRKPKMRACDHFTDVRYMGHDVNICCAEPRLAIQCDCGGATNTGGSVIHDCYVKSKLDFDAYQEW